MIVEDFMIYNNSAITKEIPYIGQLEEYFANCEKEGKKNGISDNSIVKNALHLARTKGQDYCQLVSYIANYPSRYPVPRSEKPCWIRVLPSLSLLISSSSCIVPPRKISLALSKASLRLAAVISSAGVFQI